MQYCDIESAKIAYRVFGTTPISVVIEGSLNSCNAEWWDFCEKISDLGVLVYDRPGYGESGLSKTDRTPENIANELHKLLSQLKTNSKVVIIGHSQGGLYAEVFALLFPEKVKALILLDPLSFYDYEFKERLTEKEYYSSGVDKSKMLKVGKSITGLKLGFLFKNMIKKAPPFYYHEYGKLATDYILKAATKKKQYQTALNEYELSHDKKIIDYCIKLPQNTVTKLVLITHSRNKMIEEIKYYGNATTEVAEKVENIWHEIMGKMSYKFEIVENIEASNSSHYIHLTDESLVLSIIRKNA